MRMVMLTLMVMMVNLVSGAVAFEVWLTGVEMLTYDLKCATIFLLPCHSSIATNTVKNIVTI